MALRNIAGLVEAGLVEHRGALEAVAARYAVALTPHVAGLIDVDNPDDPIAAQFVPHADELVTTPEERPDPIGDAVHSPVPGIVHRYPDRVLLKLLHVCPVYCRFCFRREVVGPGQDSVLPAEAVEKALHYIADTPAVWEVILTGGDPFLLAPHRLGEIMDRLRGIAHVKIVRFHTRVPVVDPGRVDDALVASLKRFRGAVYVALHANHPREFSTAAQLACARLVDGGIPMLSQSVLLRGINDDPAVLEALMRRFVENRIKPYYLHHADLAPGTRRFRTGLAEGQALVQGMRGHVSGICQPNYVLDIPGGFGKVRVDRGVAVGDLDGGDMELFDRHGQAHRYTAGEPAPDGKRRT